MALNPLENTCSAGLTSEKTNSCVQAADPTPPPALDIQAAVLRDQGYNYRQIAARLGISPSTAHGYVRTGRQSRDESHRRRMVAQCEEFLQLLDELEPVFVQKGRQGDIEAQEAVKDSIETRCKLLRLRADFLFASECSDG